MRSAAREDTGEARLLVVDDEPTILELLAGSLRFAGFAVMTAASGTEALRAAAASRPDLVLLDVMMPDGDGFEVLSRLVEDLLVLARFDTGRPLDRRHVDLASIAAQAVQAARIVSPGRPLTLRAGGDPVIVYADEERLRQVIDNLIANAIQHTPPRSPVTVSVTSTTTTGEITVADNGPGMTADQAARVFERFYRTDDARGRARGGTGLGLSIAAAVVAAHDGDIAVDTQPGQGAAFHVRLPLAAGTESGPEQAVPGA
jgi:two-component system, OmpR family, sensor kinase